MQATNLKRKLLEQINALKDNNSTNSLLNHSMYYEFREAFHRLFDANEGLFRSVLSRNMQNLEMQFSNETLHEKDSNSELRAIKGQFEHFIHSKMFELSKYNTNAREILQDFNAYTTMEAQTFKETIIQNMDSIEQCIIERASHEQELKMTLKKLSERQLQIQQCKVQEVQSSVTSSGDEKAVGLYQMKRLKRRNWKHITVQNNDEKNVFANERQHSEKHAAECADERAALVNLIAKLTLDTEENKTILKQLKKANASLTQELEKCKTNLDETSRALGEATSSRDSCLIALQTKQTSLRIVQSETRCACQKSLLNRSQFEGQLKEKTKVISDLKVKEGKDIDTMIEMDKQIKFLNEILYKRNQSIQTIHMLAPKCATLIGRSNFANQSILKKAPIYKPRLYDIHMILSDPGNRFCPDGEETVTLEKESRSKLDKDKVKPYNYTYQNSLYETFKPPSKAYLDQLERAKEVRKTMWRKTFVRTKPNIAKKL
ncbi:hypothetical protein Tco_1157232 [Tanacetum coccineum]